MTDSANAAAGPAADIRLSGPAGIDMASAMPVAPRRDGGAHCAPALSGALTGSGSSDAAPARPHAQEATGAEHSLAARLAARYGVLIALAGLIVLFSAARPNAFPTFTNWTSMLELASPLAVVAFGVTIPLAVGDFDLSVGGMMSLGSAVTVVLMVSGHVNWIVAVLAGLATGIAGGAANGTAIAYLGASSFIITLASGQMMEGGQYLITRQTTIFQGIPQSFISMTGGPKVIIFAAVAAVVLAVLLGFTEAGRFIYAIGINKEAARFAGVRVRRWRFICFCIVGACAALAGIMVASQSASEGTDLGTAYLLPAYAAAFLGSVVLRPGRFTILGTAVGVLFLQVLETGLAMLSLSGSTILIVEGGVLGGAILFSRVWQRGGIR
jgi:ribose transport system permease protein